MRATCIRTGGTTRKDREYSLSFFFSGHIIKVIKVVKVFKVFNRPQTESSRVYSDLPRREEKTSRSEVKEKTAQRD